MPDRIASKRARQIFQGAKPLLQTKNREIVTALREIAAGQVRRTKSETKRQVARRPVFYSVLTVFCEEIVKAAEKKAGERSGK